MALHEHFWQLRDSNTSKQKKITIKNNIQALHVFPSVGNCVWRAHYTDKSQIILNSAVFSCITTGIEYNRLEQNCPSLPLYMNNKIMGSLHQMYRTSGKNNEQKRFIHSRRNIQTRGTCTNKRKAQRAKCLEGLGLSIEPVCE